MDILIIGSGLSGATIARKAADDNKKVLILEKEQFNGGHVRDEFMDEVLIHKFGPHIFHTNNKKVIDFIGDFTEFNDFKNEVLCNIKDKVVPLPFNFIGIETFWPEKAELIKNKLIDKYGSGTRVSILDLLNQSDEDLKEVANFVYTNVFENYTTKMWGISPKEIDSSVMQRVPVVIGYETRYFSDKYEGVPKEGFSSMICKILDHPNIEVRNNVNALKVIKLKDGKVWFENKEVICPIFYSGPLDELFEYKHNILEYRSLEIKFETLDKEKYQDKAVINYPAHPEMTRITEYKHLTKQSSSNTVISREYPGEFDLKSARFSRPYYPMATDSAREIFDKYLNEINKFKNLHPIGRLATYKYLNMDQAIDLALDKYERVFNGK